jgi:hypothetical protein
MLTMPERGNPTRMGLLEHTVLRAFRFQVAKCEEGGMSEELGRGAPPFPHAAAAAEDMSESSSAAAAVAVGPDPAKAKAAVAAGPKTYKRVEMPTPDQIAMDDVMNNCGVKTVMATVMGCVLGAAMGIFFGAFEPMVPGDEKLSIVQSLKNAGRSSLQKAGSYAKGFAAFGALYSAWSARV